MNFYAAQTEAVSKQDVATFKRIERIIRHMPDVVFGVQEHFDPRCTNQVTCHLLCRALAEHVPGVSLRDGYFTQGYQHSWLVTPGNGRDERSSIIDAYPVAGVTPFIVAGDWRSPWSKLYLPADDWLTRKLAEVQLSDRVTRTCEVVRETIRRLEETDDLSCVDPF